MTLDEAIKYAEEEAKEQDKLCKRYDDASGYTRSHNEDIRSTNAKKCVERADNYRQLVEWLKDYKRLLEQQPCGDCVSRQAVLEIATSSKSNWIDNSVLFKRVNELPPVTPQPKTGHWIEKDGFDGDTYYDCSECGESFCLIDGTPTDNLYNYCPNCGCRMVEPQERSE